MVVWMFILMLMESVWGLNKNGKEKIRKTKNREAGKDDFSDGYYIFY